MRKLVIYTTVLCGALAAYLLFKRGVPLTEIAADVVQHPIGTLIHELEASKPA